MDKKSPHSYTVRLIRDSRTYWPGLAMLTVLAGLSALLQTRSSLLWGELVDSGIIRDRTAVSSSFWGLITVCLLQAILVFVNGPLNAVTTEGMFNQIRERVFEILHSVDYAVAGKRLHTGDLVSRMGSDIEELCEIFAGQYTWYLYTVGEAFVAALACVILCPFLGIVYLAVLPVTMFLLKHLTVSMTQRQHNASTDTGRGMNVASETIRCLQTVKAIQAGEEGAFLSGGQRQRVSIARALLRDAPLLVLDEATAALDSETERKWQETMAFLHGRKTILAVAHRQQTVANADHVFWLEEGRIADQGAHQELMARSVKYRQIYETENKVAWI